jgi:hypothetical protein
VLVITTILFFPTCSIPYLENPSFGLSENSTNFLFSPSSSTFKPYFDIYIKINTPILFYWCVNIKTKIRAFPTIPNKNICFPIGPILAVQFFFEKLNFFDIFTKHKSRGFDLNSLLIGLVSYKLTENFSIKEAGKWLNQEEILDIVKAGELFLVRPINFSSFGRLTFPRWSINFSSFGGLTFPNVSDFNLILFMI